MTLSSHLFKSDRCGIETLVGVVWLSRETSSNQTVAGLKRVRPPPAAFSMTRSNQTVAGLKQRLKLSFLLLLSVQIRPLRDWNWRMSPEELKDFLFKSDRCGIETRPRTATQSQYPQVQIRPLRDWNSVVRACLNVPLIVQIRPLRDWNRIALLRISEKVTVQIRPLRDWNYWSTSLDSETWCVQIRPLRDWNFAR